MMRHNQSLTQSQSTEVIDDPSTWIGLPSRVTNEIALDALECSKLLYDNNDEVDTD